MEGCSLRYTLTAQLPRPRMVLVVVFYVFTLAPIKLLVDSNTEVQKMIVMDVVNKDLRFSVNIISSGTSITLIV